MKRSNTPGPQSNRNLPATRSPSGRRSRPKNLVIKEYNPWKMFMWLAVIAVGLSVGFAVVFKIGYDVGDLDLHYDKSKNVGLLQRAIALKKRVKKQQLEIKNLQTEIARLESLSRIDAHAHTRVKQFFRDSKKENFDLNEQLKFYQSILTNKGHQGLHIHSFKIDPGAENGLYYYKVTLIQVHGLKGRHNTIRGVVNLYISGQDRQGSRKVFSLKDVSSLSESQMNFQMKYLKTFEGKLKLPAGFRPRNARVKVIQNRRRGRSQRSIEKRISWPKSSS